MKSFMQSLAAARKDPDITFLFGVIMAGEVAATMVCLYFASIFPPQVLH